MAEPNTNIKLEPGEIHFVDHYAPSLAAGEYTIEVMQSLEGSGAYQADRCFTEIQEFTVRGPRFQLNPADVYGMYPPPNSGGCFDHDLPHILLAKRSLPWERNLFVEDETVPWIALILFDTAEILSPVVGTNKDNLAANPTGVTTLSVAELAHPKPDEPGTFQAYRSRQMDGDELAQTCQVIDISPEVFRLVMPSRNEVKFLAHCRVVNPDSKAASGPPRPGTEIAPGSGIAWYAVVVGGRFPVPPVPGQSGRLNAAHLVSLEGLEGFLDDPGRANFAPEIQRIRLVSLASWTFTCLPEKGESFSELMSGLAAGDATGRLEFKLPTQFPGPATPAEEKYVLEVLEKGYVPCSYQTRQGERTFAWYRGPFTPQPVPRFPPDREPFTSSTQAMVYDPDHGLFDLSYAVAWETGRLLALADQTFGVALLNWRRKAHRLINGLLEQPGLSVGLPGEGAPQAGGPAQGENTAIEAFKSTFLNNFATQIEPVIFKPVDQEPAEPAPALPQGAGPAKPLDAAYQDEGTRARMQAVGGEELDSILKWLAHLYLLYGVPVHDLIPDERLLPPESIRFFYLDRNWLEAMQDGAFSLGIQSRRDIWHRDALYGFIRKGLDVRVPALRTGLVSGEAAAPTPENAGKGQLAGLLLRSAAVSGWPGLEVRAYAGSDGRVPSGPAGLLRMDRLSEDVLFCLFDQIPAWIELDEPVEGLHFGAEGRAGLYCFYLSGAGPAEKPVVQKLEGHRKLNIQALLEEMKMLGCKLSPAAFALQMVKKPGRMVFQRAGSRS